MVGVIRRLAGGKVKDAASRLTPGGSNTVDLTANAGNTTPLRGGRSGGKSLADDGEGAADAVSAFRGRVSLPAIGVGLVVLWVLYEARVI